ncbi:transcription initiation factor TFIIE subunit alpha [Nematocida sp. AWRm77]|nr:transcription initiation factor TFIIE subunit alpha [Nematocida sp. AWRm77]
MEQIRESMCRLVQRVTRMFYEPHHIVIMDIMLHHLVLDEEELADKMKLLPREFNRMVIKLKDDRLLSSETISGLKEDGRQETLTRFFLDFRTIRDVVKYKIYTMTQRLEKRMREKESTLGFGCAKCSIVYSVLDAQSFLSTQDYTFRCPECGEELKEKKEAEQSHTDNVSAVFTQMMGEVAPIITQLKELDSLGISEMLRGKIIFAHGEGEKSKGHLPTAEESAASKQEEEDLPADMEQLEDLEEKEDLPKPEGVMISVKESSKEASAHSEIEEMLTVGGERKKFKDITESDKEKMNDDEYEKYFEIFEKYSTSV